MLILRPLNLALTLPSQVLDDHDDHYDNSNAASDGQQDVDKDDHPDAWSVVIRIEFLDFRDSVDLSLFKV